MSYFGTSSSGNNPLSFPSYNQQNLQQRSISGLGPISSVNQLQNQFNGSGLNSNLHQGEGHSSQRSERFIKSDEVNDTQDSVNGAGTERLKGPGLHDVGNSEKSRLKRDRRNRPGQKFGAKKRSWVWSWFVQDSSDQNVAVCDFCGKVITRVASDRGSPKKLSEHLHTHKLTKNSINTTRSVPIDGNGISFSGASLQMPYVGPYSHQSANCNTTNSDSSISQTQLRLSPPSQQPRQPQRDQQSQLPTVQSQSQKAKQLPQHTTSDSVTQEHNQNAAKYRRANAISMFSEAQRIHPQLQHQMTNPVPSNPTSSASYGRRYSSSNFENSPYSGSKFHRHLLKFLAENKLSIRLLKSHSFQQLIYDLRPESISDLLDLTGLYSSFVEVARVENLTDASENRESTAAEANVVNTLAQELIKK